MLLKTVLGEQFMAQTKNVLKEGSTELKVILKAFSCVLESEGKNVVNTLMESLLTIHLYNASTSISNARSVTSSYRMTNKPGRRLMRDTMISSNKSFFLCFQNSLLL